MSSCNLYIYYMFSYNLYTDGLITIRRIMSDFMQYLYEGTTYRLKGEYCTGEGGGGGGGGI